jgi:ribosome-binding protein aMBF1 (putative translation factor)
MMCPINIGCLAQAQKRTTKRRQVQPASGPEKAFGQALREIREEKGISQERLALDAGFDRTFVSLLERGLRKPTIRTVVKLAAILKVKPSEIVQRMEAHLAKGRKKPSSRQPTTPAPAPPSLK